MASFTFTSAAIFLYGLLLASFSEANSFSAATCPIDVALRLDSCSKLANGIIGGGGGARRLPRDQCCSALVGLSSQEAADCLCVVLQGDISGSIDATLGRILNICEMEKPEGYVCVGSS